MREILFRGKRTENEKWIEGFYYKDDTTGMVFIITWEDGKDRGCLTIEEFREVMPVTVGQFTGVTDKNGKKIFEGDIVKPFSAIGKPEDIGVVSWHELFSAWRIGDISTMYGSNHVATYEVIGNIHDNPELLE